MGRSPCGERGLKSYPCPFCGSTVTSLPVRGAWIEIYYIAPMATSCTSLPVRGAWIEISVAADDCELVGVAPRAGSVD